MLADIPRTLKFIKYLPVYCHLALLWHKRVDIVRARSEGGCACLAAGFLSLFQLLILLKKVFDVEVEGKRSDLENLPRTLFVNELCPTVVDIPLIDSDDVLAEDFAKFDQILCLYICFECVDRLDWINFVRDHNRTLHLLLFLVKTPVVSLQIFNDIAHMLHPNK